MHAATGAHSGTSACVLRALISLPTFYFGEGEHRTVAGGQRGDPGGVFLHYGDEEEKEDELGWAELGAAATTSLKPIWCRHTGAQDGTLWCFRAGVLLPVSLDPSDSQWCV